MKKMNGYGGNTSSANTFGVIGISIYPGQEIPIKSGTNLSVGRGNECNLIVNEPSISRVHCLVRWNSSVRCLEVTAFSVWMAAVFQGASLSES